MQLSEFIKAEQSIHNHVRIIGAIAKSYFPPVADGSHTNMAWNSVQNRLESRRFKLSDARTVFISYEPGKFLFQFGVDERDSEIILTSGKPLSTILYEFEAILNAFELDGKDFRQHVGFRFPELFDQHEVSYLPAIEMIQSFEKIRTSANESLKRFLNEFDQISEIRVWEHNFDTGIFCEYDNGFEQFAGYTPADKEASKVPYFYNSFFNRENQKVVPIDFPELSEGYWETERWGGAILPVTPSSTSDDLLNASSAFLSESSRIFLSNADSIA